MALPPDFLDELRARTPLSALIGRRVKLSKSGRNWKGCCPFHGEKSPSFYVYDDHFHCFGCGVHGDAISFQMQSSGASFPEAVESLAAEAGLDVPKASPAQARAEQNRLDLHEILEHAHTSFLRRLRAPEGAAALNYLRTRGLSDATIEQFGIGWSGDGRGSLTAELRAVGVEPGRMLEAGLLRETESGELRELYWGRVIFPIRDRRGRLISFGGRALGDAKPKYINGPESPIFPKRRILYAADRAREPIRGGQRLVVVEGYMDVIALHQAGHTGAVAPLGTALTDDHFEEIWRLHPNPVLCFDGDAAGGKAAERAILVALPLLKPGFSLQVATLAPGEDPDSLVRTQGAAAFDAVCDNAAPLVDALFAALSRGVGDGPEQRAALRVRIEASAKTIPDRILAGEFRSALLDRVFKSRSNRKAPPPKRTRTAPDGDSIAERRAMILLALLLRHPELIAPLDDALHRIPLPAEFEPLRNELSAFAHDDALDSASLIAHLTHSGVNGEASRVLSATAQDLPDHALAHAMPVEVQKTWWHFYGLLTGPSHLQEEVAYARQALEIEFSKANQDRVVALRQAEIDLNDLFDTE
jgi:DNA primase